ncbi:hypothetical protein JCM10908_003178 [Rhodotorula pacifica]|uniref:uncharacterized protein n=1 Tax=Rhodotorula pacifica TaxID=1495444 RepID=UPI003170C1E8
MGHEEWSETFLAYGVTVTTISLSCAVRAWPDMVGTIRFAHEHKAASTSSKLHDRRAVFRVPSEIWDTSCDYVITEALDAADDIIATELYHVPSKYDSENWHPVVDALWDKDRIPTMSDCDRRKQDFLDRQREDRKREKRYYRQERERRAREQEYRDREQERRAHEQQSPDPYWRGGQAQAATTTFGTFVPLRNGDEPDPKRRKTDSAGDVESDVDGVSKTGPSTKQVDKNESKDAVSEFAAEAASQQDNHGAQEITAEDVGEANEVSDKASAEEDVVGSPSVAADSESMSEDSESVEDDEDFIVDYDQISYDRTPQPSLRERCDDMLAWYGLRFVSKRTIRAEARRWDSPSACSIIAAPLATGVKQFTLHAPYDGPISTSAQFINPRVAADWTPRFRHVVRQLQLDVRDVDVPTYELAAQVPEIGALTKEKEAEEKAAAEEKAKQEEMEAEVAQVEPHHPSQYVATDSGVMVWIGERSEAASEAEQPLKEFKRVPLDKVEPRWLLLSAAINCG